MNTISLYLGYSSWYDYLEKNDIDSDWNFTDKSIYINDMSEGTSIRVKYLDRIVLFQVIILENTKVLQVKESVNSSLRVNDILYIYKLKQGECIQSGKVIRDGKCGNYKTRGVVSFLEIVE